MSDNIKTFKNVVVTYDKETGYLYIDDEETDEQLAVFEPTKDRDTINSLKSEIAYLKGEIAAYEKYLRKMGLIADSEEEE